MNVVLPAWLWATIPVAALALASALTYVAPDVRAARARAAIGATLGLALATLAALFGRLDGPTMHFHAWSPLSFGLDRLSAPLAPFVVAIGLAVVLGTPNRFASGSVASTRSAADRSVASVGSAADGSSAAHRSADPRAGHGHYFARLLANVALSLALLAARTPLTLAIFWILSGVPMLAELRGRRGFRIFVVQHVASSTLVLAGVVVAKLAALESFAAPLLVLGIMVREGIFPFHAWVPRFFVRAPLGSALVFVQPQIGAYVLARWVVADPLGGSASWLLDVLGVVTMLYGAALALGQRSARRALGYLAVSQSALVLLGLADGGLLGATGALLVIVAVGLAQTGFGLAISATEARRGPLRLDVESGGFSSTPALAGATLMLGLSSIGLPGTLAFVAEDLVFHATLEARPWVGVVMVLATAINGIAVLRIAFRLFGGRTRRTGEGDLTRRERFVLGVVGAVLVTLGLVPQPVLAPTMEAFEHLVEPTHASAAR
jgi:NADH-quinone oxidoreductase subunit M